MSSVHPKRGKAPVDATPAAEARSASVRRPTFFTRADLAHILSDRQADPALTAELAYLAGDTTDDVDQL